jgi:hypothetical protein
VILSPESGGIFSLAGGIFGLRLMQMMTSMQMAIARTAAPATDPIIKGSFDEDAGAGGDEPQYAALFGLGHRNGLPSYLCSHAPPHG